MSKTERITHLFLIALATVSMVLLLERRFAPRGEAGPPAVQLIGRPLDVPGVRWDRAPLNAVLYLAANCHFCKESLPFYRRLIEGNTSRHPPISFIVITKEDPKGLTQLLSQERVAVGGVYRINGPAVLRGTPTLLVVDSRGRVTEVLEGKLDAVREQQFENSLQKAIRPGQPVTMERQGVPTGD